MQVTVSHPWKVYLLLTYAVSGAGVSVPAPPPSEAPTSPRLLKTFSSKLLRSMRRSSEAKEPLSTQMSNLSPNRQHAESAGTPIVILLTSSLATMLMMMMIMTTISNVNNDDVIKTRA